MSERDLRTLLGHVAGREDELLEQAVANDATRRALAERATRRRAPVPAAWPRFALAGAFAGLVVGLMLFGSSWFRERTLSFTVGEAARPGTLHAWEAAPAHAGLPIRFSDGTEVRLEPQSRAQIVRLEAEGAEIVLDAGRAHVDVVPREGGDWRLRAGPIVVYVKGTRFDLSWDARSEDFSLRLYEGRVVVQGCSFGDGRVVRQGEQVHGTCRSDEAAKPAAALEPAPLPTLPESAPPPASAAPAKLAASSRAEGDKAWRSLAREGHFRRAYDAAVAAGFENECERASAADLLLLGDAARLSAQHGAAAQAYGAARRRFPRTDAAARAAFTLGRLAFDSGNPAGAMRWFETYLAEQPSGALAPSAFDRLLEAALRVGDGAGTRAIAERYLARYPNGAYADEARRLTQ